MTPAEVEASIYKECEEYFPYILKARDVLGQSWSDAVEPPPRGDITEWLEQFERPSIRELNKEDPRRFTLSTPRLEVLSKIAKSNGWVLHYEEDHSTLGHVSIQMYPWVEAPPKPIEPVEFKADDRIDIPLKEWKQLQWYKSNPICRLARWCCNV